MNASRPRIRILAAAFGAGFALIAARLYDLQIRRHDDYARRRERQSRSFWLAPQPPGSIRSADGRLLAHTICAPSVAADPARIADPAAAAQALAPVLRIPEPDLRRRLETRSRFVWLARHIPEEVAARVRSLGLPGVFLREEYVRVHPFGPATAHLVGFTDLDGHGLEGIEHAAGALLRGSPVRTPLVVDARRRPVAFPEGLAAPKAGAHLVLTVDMKVQRALAEALAAGAERTRASSVWAVALDPRTGAVRGLAVFPSYDPDGDRGDPALRRNRVVTDPFEPGSTMKPFVLARALERGVVALDTPVDCGSGAERIGPRMVRDHKPLGVLAARDVVVHSSNVGIARIGWALGAQELRALLSDLGFGRATRCGLPGEDPGRIPAPAQWTTFSTATVPFGYEISVTALQLAAAYAALANDGVRMQPYVVEEVRDDTGALLWKAASVPAGRVADPAIARAVLGVLVETVERGTGQEARVEGLRVAGKTGTMRRYDPATGRYEDGRYRAAFCGIAPAEDPRIVVVVVVDDPKGEYYAARTAAPIARQFLEKIRDSLAEPDRSGPPLASRIREEP